MHPSIGWASPTSKKGILWLITHTDGKWSEICVDRIGVGGGGFPTCSRNRLTAFLQSKKDFLHNTNMLGAQDAESAKIQLDLHQRKRISNLQLNDFLLSGAPRHDVSPQKEEQYEFEVMSLHPFFSRAAWGSHSKQMAKMHVRHTSRSEPVLCVSD